MKALNSGGKEKIHVEWNEMEWNGMQRNGMVWRRVENENLEQGNPFVRTFVIRSLVAKATIRYSKKQKELILSL